MRDFNERFIMVPVSLLEVPAFVRYFDSKSIGSIYRVLCSKVWRKSSVSVKKSAGDRFFTLSKLYDSGYLSSIYDLSSLASAVGYTERNVRRDLDKLIELGLVVVEKINGEVFYIVGESSLTGKTGLSLGVHSEYFYINRWRDFVNYASEYDQTKLNLFSEDLEKFLRFGQFCHFFLTNLSQISTIDDLKNFVLDGKTSDESASLIDKVIELKPSSKVDEEGFVPKMAGMSPEDALKFGRKLLREEKVTLAEVNSVLKSKVDEEFASMISTPRFAISLHTALYNAEEKSSDIKRVTSLWSSLREDFAGVSGSSSSSREYSKISAIVKNLLSKYSYQQIIWSMKKTVERSISDAEFMANGVTTLEFFVKKYAKEYQGMRNEMLNLKSSRANIGLLEEQRKADEESLKVDNENVGDENTGRILDLLGW